MTVLRVKARRGNCGHGTHSLIFDWLANRAILSIVKLRLIY